MAEVTTAMARGDLSKKITVDVRGEILELKITINTMTISSTRGVRVTRVAKKSAGRPAGRQAEIKGVAGTWRDLTDNVNQLAGNLTVQLRNVSKVATAIATGDHAEDHRRGAGRDPADQERHQHDDRPAQRVRVRSDARGARDRHRGKTGGQADVRGVAGTWRDLTDSVNFMAGT